VNLIGEHVDYNQGFVLPMAIDRYTVIMADAMGDVQSPSILLRAYSSTVDSLRELSESDCSARQLPHHDISNNRPTTDWTAYLCGVWHGCRQAGLVCPPIDLLVDSTVPMGGGLSSSAALEVAMASLIETISQQSLDPLQKILLCQRAEHEFARVPCGVMDQFASVMGKADHLLLLDCRSNQCVSIPMPAPAPRVLIIDSHVKHALGSSEYAARRRECHQAAAALGVESLRDISTDDLHPAAQRMDNTLYRRARHVVTEIERTRQAADAIRAGDWDLVGRLMDASHRSLRDDFEVSCPEVDRLVQLLWDQGPGRGVYGARMTGAGFGGCVVSLVDEAVVTLVGDELAHQYQQATGIRPTLFITRPAGSSDPK
jgi:galactokinase